MWTRYNNIVSCSLCEQLKASSQANAESISKASSDVDVFFILWAAALVFMMHLGFAMLSAGSIRIKSTTNILMCIVLDACMCCIAWWIAGWAFAYGGSFENGTTENNVFIGAEFFLGIGFETVWPAQDWFFQFAFAATAATIVSGAVAERASFEAYLSYSFFLSFWVYPVVVHWVCNSSFIILPSTDKKISGMGWRLAHTWWWRCPCSPWSWSAWFCRLWSGVHDWWPSGCNWKQDYWPSAG